MNLIRFVIVLAAAFTTGASPALAAAPPTHSEDEPAPPIAVNQAPGVPSANALYREFRNNPVDATRKYAGQTVVLEGFRGDVILLSNGVGAAVHIQDGGKSNALILSFPNRAQLSGIDEGELFTFRCVVDKYEYVSVWMEFCSIVR